MWTSWLPACISGSCARSRLETCLRGRQCCLPPIWPMRYMEGLTRACTRIVKRRKTPRTAFARPSWSLCVCSRGMSKTRVPQANGHTQCPRGPEHQRPGTVSQPARFSRQCDYHETRILTSLATSRVLAPPVMAKLHSRTCLCFYHAAQSPRVVMNTSTNMTLCLQRIACLPCAWCRTTSHSSKCCLEGAANQSRNHHRCAIIPREIKNASLPCRTSASLPPSSRQPLR